MLHINRQFVMSPTLLDSTMPTYDVREVHEVAVDAPPEVVWSALHEVSLRAVPVFRGLMTLRELPGVLLGSRWLTADVDRPILEQMTAAASSLSASGRQTRRCWAS